MPCKRDIKYEPKQTNKRFKNAKVDKRVRQLDELRKDVDHLLKKVKHFQKRLYEVYGKDLNCLPDDSGISMDEGSEQSMSDKENKN